MTKALAKRLGLQVNVGESALNHSWRDATCHSVRFWEKERAWIDAPTRERLYEGVVKVAKKLGFTRVGTNAPDQYVVAYFYF